MRSVRQECLDHLLILHEKQLQRLLIRYVLYFNQARPHQGIQQQIPEPRSSSHSSHDTGDKVIAVPILGGLHHDYQRVASLGRACSIVQPGDEMHPVSSVMCKELLADR
jgi:hypothetical protein